jgi:hypothetical protein
VPAFESTAHQVRAVPICANICSPVVEYEYTIAEHDQTTPWLVVRTERRSVELPEGEDFYAWASRTWPHERFTVQLAPRLPDWPSLG